ncbi:hypothetical protein MPTK1_2g23145 [Marchantia polymorpha subsp. ruderalis]
MDFYAVRGEQNRVACAALEGSYVFRIFARQTEGTKFQLHSAATTPFIKSFEIPPICKRHVNLLSDCSEVICKRRRDRQHVADCEMRSHLSGVTA